MFFRWDFYFILDIKLQNKKIKKVALVVLVLNNHAFLHVIGILNVQRMLFFTFCGTIRFHWCGSSFMQFVKPNKDIFFCECDVAQHSLVQASQAEISQIWLKCVYMCSKGELIS